MSTTPLIAFRADADLRAQIEALAKKERGTMSDVLRQAMEVHLSRIAAADLDAGPTKVSFLVGSIFGATSTIAARSAAELADLAAAYRAAADQAALGADDRAALMRASGFLKGSADALRCLADRFRLSPSNANGAT
ncbi:MAG: hypothetical protein KDJ16_13425 [Hyphomicrobiales bacterium]|nr:hypothetical protein [Hyphomicrobiales bacterium]